MPSSDASPRHGGHRVVGALEKRGGVLTRRAVMPVRAGIGPLGKRGRSLRGLRHRQRDALQRCGSSVWRAPRCRCPRKARWCPHPPGGDARAICADDRGGGAGAGEGCRVFDYRGGIERRPFYRPGGKARTFIARPEASTTRCPPAMRVLGMEGTALSVPKAALQSPGGIRERGCRTVEGLTPPANASSAECKGGVRAGRNRDLFRYAR